MKRDEDLISVFLNGSAEAFTELVRRYEKEVYHTALRMIGDEEEARDITQGAFLKALKGLGSLKDPSSFRAWLLSITTNLIRDTLRESRFREDRVDSEEEFGSCNRDAFHKLVVMEERERALAALCQLPSRQRMAIVLRIYNELPFKEIAQIMECETATARSLFWIGVKRLRTLLEETYEV